jgi:hypothetical protein
MNIRDPQFVQNLSVQLQKLKRDRLCTDPHVSNATNRLLELAIDTLDALEEQLTEDLEAVS